jgi:hypothetical protein
LVIGTVVVGGEIYGGIDVGTGITLLDGTFVGTTVDGTTTTDGWELISTIDVQ